MFKLDYNVTKINLIFICICLIMKYTMMKKWNI